jgi:hypothetical protein
MGEPGSTSLEAPKLARRYVVPTFCQGIMMKIYKVMASMLVLVAGCAGRDVEDEGVTTQCEALINAPLSPDTSGVGLCIGLTAGPGGEQTCPIGCSATLIAKNLVLTARHCVQGGVGPRFFDGSFSAPMPNPEVFNVTLSSSWAVGNPSWYSVNQVLVPGSTDHPNDIALVILNDTIEERDATPAGVDLTTNLAAPDHPTEFTIIGRGVVHYDLDAQGQPINVDTGDSQRRILQHVPFVCASDSTSTPCVVFSPSAPPTYARPLPLEFFNMGLAIMAGDSGAGIFSQQSYDASAACGAPRVVAVATAGTIREDGQSAGTLGVRVGRFADFLRAGAETAARFGHYQKPAWADD